MTQRVRMLTLSAGPLGVRHPGAEYDLEDDEALELIEARAAVFVSPRRETATRPPAPERATLGKA